MHTTKADCDSIPLSKIGDVVAQLLEATRMQERLERRSESRHPFFCPVAILSDHGKNWSAFAREISRSGIGLLHNMPLEPGEVTLQISIPSGPKKFRTQIVWCRPSGEGWYLSGGRFLDVEAESIG